MRKIQWKSRRTLYVITSVILLYLFLRIKKYKYYDFVILPKVKPMEPWEYVADFSNMKNLNPTIIDFDIVTESGNYEHWKYTIKYSENLSHWPYLRNNALASYDVKSGPEKNIYYVNSIHTTCMIFGCFCLDSSSSFKFSASESIEGALCEETIEYQCPAILSSFCEREVQFQRTAILTNLSKYFSNIRNVHL